MYLLSFDTSIPVAAILKGGLIFFLKCKKGFTYLNLTKKVVRGGNAIFLKDPLIMELK